MVAAIEVPHRIKGANAKRDPLLDDTLGSAKRHKATRDLITLSARAGDAELQSILSSIKSGATTDIVLEDPFLELELSPASEQQHISVSYLRRMIRRAGGSIMSEDIIEGISKPRFEDYVAKYKFRVDMPANQQRNVRVALMIKACPQDFATLVANVRHITEVLDGGCNFSEIVLVADLTRSDDFLRQFVDGVDMNEFEQSLKRIVEERLVDRIIRVEFGREDEFRRINRDWFDEEHAGTHSEQGAQYSSTFKAFEEIYADIIFQTDVDIIFTGRREIWQADILQKYIQCVFDADPQALTCGFPITTRNPAPLGYHHLDMGVWKQDGLKRTTYRIEVRCCLFHRRRLLDARPFRVPDWAKSTDPRWLINSQLEGWYQVVDWNIDMRSRSTGEQLRSYRGSIGTASGFVHPPNELKTDTMKYMWIADRVARTQRKEIAEDPKRQCWDTQLDYANLQEADWLAERDEPIVFICCGYRHKVGRVLRCLSSLKRQRGIEKCGIVLLDDATEAFADARHFLFEKASTLFAHKVTCINTQVHQGFLANTITSIRSIVSNQNSIVVTLDQDDCLLGDGVVEYLLDIFSDPDVECAIGGAVRTDKPRIPALNIDNPRQARGGGNCWQHLRAFRQHLAGSIHLEDLKDDAGQWFDVGADWALMIPIVEMARKTYVIPEHAALYLWEPSEDPRNGVESNGRGSAQEVIINQVASLLQKRAPYSRR